MEIRITSEQAMRAFGGRLAAAIADGRAPRVIELVGDVGAGKTTLVKGLAVGLGITEDVASPSFTISRVYDAVGGLVLYHYDFYRLTDAGILRNELSEVTATDDAVTVIEWADIVEDVLPEPRVRVSIRATDESTRTVLVYGVEVDVS